MITYSQLLCREEPPRTYYDPNLLYNERAFTIQAGEEILLLISGTGFQFEDETIYQLEQDKNAGGKFVLQKSPSDRQLCILLQNKSTEKCYHVARKTSLALLMEMPRLKSYLCHVSITHMTQTRLEKSMRSTPTPLNFRTSPTGLEE